MTALVAAGALVASAWFLPASAEGGPEDGPTTTVGPTTTAGPTTTGGPTTTEAPTTTTEAPTTTTMAPPPPVVGRPDALIRTSSQATFGGNNIYNTTGGSQSRTAEVEPGKVVRFYVQIQNDAGDPADIKVWGTAENTNFAVRYYRGQTGISPQVKAGTFTVQDVAPGDDFTLTIEIQPRAGAPRNIQRKVVVSARSVVNPSVKDNVAATATIPPYTAEQRRIAQLVNQTRHSNGRGQLALQRQLTDKAQAWAERLARDGYLHHSVLTDGAPAGWRGLAENVGDGSSISVVHQAFLASPGHRANILGNYNYIGTGYAEGHGKVWIVHVFMLR